MSGTSAIMKMIQLCLDSNSKLLVDMRDLTPMNKGVGEGPFAINLLET